ncbi:MAG: FAD-dependent oxidoreductase [Candidatus Diapherotrites archaeon]
MDEKNFDLIIVGSGPTGYGAAIYAARYRLKTLVLGEINGGMITETNIIENYAGTIKASGLELMGKFKEHVKAAGVTVIHDRVAEAKKTANGFELNTKTEGSFNAKTIIFATGSRHKELNVPGEKELRYKGVNYCATCDAPLFEGKTVAVIGGSDSAAKEALLCAEYAKKVYIIYRGDDIRPEPINKERVLANKKIEIINKTNVAAIEGKNSVEKLKFDNGKELKVDGVFIDIGHIAENGLALSLGVKCDDWGQIMVDGLMQTNVPGIFAAGDIINHKFKQVIWGTATGSLAAKSAWEYLGAMAVQKK